MRRLSALWSFCVFATLALHSPCAQAQMYQVIHDFSHGADGAHPQSGVTIDGFGSLYVTATGGGFNGTSCGSSGCGVVLKLIRQSPGWTAIPLYTFQGSGDGWLPDASVTVASNGTLFSTTSAGGIGNNGYGYGTVFNLQPGARVCQNTSCSWTETVLHSFAAGADGWQPTLGNLVFDGAGNIYGTTMDGGSNGCYGGFGCGVVFKLAPGNGGWTETVMYSFAGGADGAYPQSGVALDSSGNIYGTTTAGGSGTCNSYVGGCGVVFKLSPSVNGWTETVLHSFTGGADGGIPEGGLILSNSGVLYGTTEAGGSGNGTAFAYSLAEQTLSTIYAFPGPGLAGPAAGLALDVAGNLYGTTLSGPPNSPPCAGSVFELSPSAGGWNYRLLYCFSGGVDGGSPYSPVSIGANHVLYGTTYSGGAYGDGVVWELMP
ncbi:MAG TPA: choice-of-anchor tandem repeat GloVer-containing protein [Terriglobales bacterium]|nr:choice-of-anchor tandem repeat GloVer-containing protein [Terriglobales bacterium]